MEENKWAALIQQNLLNLRGGRHSEKKIQAATNFLLHLLEHGGEKALESFCDKVDAIWQEAQPGEVPAQTLLGSLEPIEKKALEHAFPKIKEVQSTALLTRRASIAAIIAGAFAAEDGLRRRLWVINEEKKPPAARPPQNELQRHTTIAAVEVMGGATGVGMGTSHLLKGIVFADDDKEQYRALQQLTGVINALGSVAEAQRDNASDRSL